MNDHDIVELYWNRDERAISRSREKYGNLLRSIAENILHSSQDAEECENDTYLGAWNSIPPARPQNLSAYLAKLARNISISKHRANSAQKRGGGEVLLSLDELNDCIPNTNGSANEISSPELLSDALNIFLASLSAKERQIFICRYWRCDAISDIAKRFGFGNSKVKMTLMRTRSKLRNFLEKEGIFYDK